MKTTYAALIAAALFGAATLAGTAANAAPMAPLGGYDNPSVVKVDDMHGHRMHRMMRHEHHMMRREHRRMHREHRMMRHMRHRMMRHHDHM